MVKLYKSINVKIETWKKLQEIRIDEESTISKVVDRLLQIKEESEK